MQFIILVFLVCSLAQELQLDTLHVAGNIIAQQITIEQIGRTLKQYTLICENLHTQSINTNIIEIHDIFTSDSLALKYISPMKPFERKTEQTEEAEVIELEESFIQRPIQDDEIRIHGSARFMKGVIYAQNQEEAQQASGLNLNGQGTARTKMEFLEIGDQSQWMPMQAHSFDQETDGWKVVSKSEVMSDSKKEMQQLKKMIRHNEFHDFGMEQGNDMHIRDLIDKFRVEELGSLQGGKNDALVYEQDNLPGKHTYIQIQANFLFKSYFWRQNSKAWLKVDGEIVWMQPYKNQQSRKICELLQEILGTVEMARKVNEGSRVYEHLRALESEEWLQPVLVSVKHIERRVKIEFGMKLGKLPEQCSHEQQLVLSELESGMRLFGIDDFLLFYK